MSEYKWGFKLTPEERKQYPPNRVLVWYDRVFDEYYTASGVKLDRFLEPIKESENKRVIRRVV